MNKKLIDETIHFVKAQLKNAEGGHDWFHIERVFKSAQYIAKKESVDDLVVALGALLHDIADSKFHSGDESLGPKIVTKFLMEQGVASSTINHVIKIIENCSFKGGHKSSDFSSRELDVVQDADRLDAIGAIGIARTFNYGGFKNRALYDPEILPNLHMTKEEYKASTAPTINHFYEKLLLLKDQMNTPTGILLAQKRHDFMEQFLHQFYGEWQGKL